MSLTCRHLESKNKLMRRTRKEVRVERSDPIDPKGTDVNQQGTSDDSGNLMCLKESRLSSSERP